MEEAIAHFIWRDFIFKYTMNTHFLVEFKIEILLNTLLCFLKESFVANGYEGSILEMEKPRYHND